MTSLPSSARVGAAVLVSRVLGVVRDSLFASVFGVSALTDSFVVAYRIPNLLRDLFAEGALSSAFVPTFAEALARDGQERAYRLGNLVISGLVVVTGLVTVAGLVAAEPLVRLLSGGFSGDPPELAALKVADATAFARVMMPILLLVSVAAGWMGMLVAQQRYGAPSFAPALFNVTSIVCGLAIHAAGVPAARAMFLWSAATTVAALAQTAVQLPSLWRLGFRPRLMFAGFWSEPRVRRIGRLMGPAVLGLAAIQINVFVNTQFAGALGTGPLTYLNNAFRLFYLPVGLFGVALATVTGARASADVARGDRTTLAAIVAEGARGVWMLAVPSAAGLIVLAEPVVAVLFQRGNFHPADTAATVPVVQAYMLGVLPYSLVKVYSPGFFALHLPRVPMLASLAAVATNLLFNAATYRALGAPGLALGTSLAALVNVAVLRLALPRLAGAAPGPLADRTRALAAVAGATAVLAAVAAAGWWLAARALRALAVSAPAAVGWSRGALLFAVIGVAFVVYALVLRALRHPAADELWHLPVALGRRLRGGGKG